MAETNLGPISEAEKKNWVRYRKALHAMQSGVAHEMSYDGKPTQPKHLRVGVNAVHRDLASLAILLVSKGVITIEEYSNAMADGMELEVAAYERSLSKHSGTEIKLV